MPYNNCCKHERNTYIIITKPKYQIISIEKRQIYSWFLGWQERLPNVFNVPGLYIA